MLVIHQLGKQTSAISTIISTIISHVFVGEIPIVPGERSIFCGQTSRFLRGSPTPRVALHQVYGALNEERRSEWQPTFELTAPNGSAVVVYPGMVHDVPGEGVGVVVTG